MTVRLRCRSHRSPKNPQAPHGPQSPVRQTPFTGGKAVQLTLEALPQLLPQLHWNVAEPLWQEAVFDTVALVPPGVAPAEPEQPLPHVSVVAGQRDAQDCVSVALGLLAGSQASPPQLG